MTTLHTGCGREVHHGGCTCREDAEIAALKAEVERLKRALAAGPAALRAMMAQDNHGDTFDACAEIVEAAQEAAMKEGK